MDTISKKKRKSYKEIFTPYQLSELQKYFVEVKQKPKHVEKKELADRLKINPITMNNWFQSERSKISKRKRAAAGKLPPPKKQQA